MNTAFRLPQSEIPSTACMLNSLGGKKHTLHTLFYMQFF